MIIYIMFNGINKSIFTYENIKIIKPNITMHNWTFSFFDNNFNLIFFKKNNMYIIKNNKNYIFNNYYNIKVY